MALSHMPRRTKSGRFKKGGWSKRSSRRGKRTLFHHRGHRSARWRVVCGSKTRSWHRKKSAAKRARPRGCRVVSI